MCRWASPVEQPAASIACAELAGLHAEPVEAFDGSPPGSFAHAERARAATGKTPSPAGRLRLEQAHLLALPAPWLASERE